MTPNRPDGGFTLIELLTVMAIIATLAGIAIMGVPAILRQADRTACQERLRKLHQQFVIYQTNNRALSRASGPAFVLSIWDNRQIDHTEKDADLFFCPSTGNEPFPDLSAVTPEGIDYTGPDQSRLRKPLRLSEPGANARVIVCDRVPLIEGDDELRRLPHDATGVSVLFLGGATDFIEAGDFSDGLPMLGEQSSVESLQWMVPDEAW